MPPAEEPDKTEEISDDEDATIVGDNVDDTEAVIDNAEPISADENSEEVQFYTSSIQLYSVQCIYVLFLNCRALVMMMKTYLIPVCLLRYVETIFSIYII